MGGGVGGLYSPLFRTRVGVIPNAFWSALPESEGPLLVVTPRSLRKGVCCCVGLRVRELCRFKTLAWWSQGAYIRQLCHKAYQGSREIA